MSATVAIVSMVLTVLLFGYLVYAVLHAEDM